MTATKKFIDDAIAGGCEINNFDVQLYPQIALLETEVWRAVGKARGWRERSENTFEAEHTCWQAYWSGFYYDLADGKTIEEALSAIS